MFAIKTRSVKITFTQTLCHFIRLSRIFTLKTLPIIIFFLACSNLSYANKTLFHPSLPEELNFKHLGIKEGLLAVSISCIYQDSKGYIWLGANNAIYRYDGFDFVIYEIEYLKNEAVLSMVEFSQDKFLIGTTEGLIIFDAITQKTKVFKHNPNNPNSISTGNIDNIYIDKERKTAWLPTYSGLNEFDLITEKFTKYPLNKKKPNNQNENKIYQIAFDGKQGLWLATRSKGLAYFDLNQKVYKTFNYPLKPFPETKGFNNFIRSLTVTKEGKIWAGGISALYFINPDTKTVKTYNFAPPFPKHKYSEIILKVKEDGYGNILIMADHQGLIFFNPANEKFSHASHQLDNPFSLSANDITSLFIDKDNLLWVGTSSRGINIWDPETIAFSHIRYKKDANYSINKTSIHSVFEDSRGDLWIGHHSGLEKVSKDGSIEHYYDIRGNGSKAPFYFIYQITEDNNGNIWLATRNGLKKIDVSTKKVKTYAADSESELSKVERVFYEKPDIIWFIKEGVLFRLEERSGKIKTYRHKLDDIQSISKLSPLLNTPIIKNHGAIWLITPTGINRYVEKEDYFIRFPIKSLITDTSQDEKIIAIAFINQSNFYLATNKRIMKLSTSTNGNISSIEETLEFNEKIINVQDILLESPDYLWIASQMNLTRLNTNNRNLKNYNTKSGLALFFHSYPSMQRTNNKINIASKVRAITIDLKKLHPIKPYKKDLKVTKIDIYKQHQNIEHLYLTPKSIHLSYTDIGFKVFSSPLDFLDPDAYQFRYRLLGHGDEWILTESNSITYSNLKAGAYKLEIDASNDGKNWVSLKQPLIFNIHPPYWKTWWAYSLYLLIFLSIIATIIFFKRSKDEEKRKLHKQQNLFGKTFSSTKESIIILNSNKKVIAVNDAFSETLHYQQEDCLGKEIDFLCPDSSKAFISQHTWDSIEKFGHWYNEIWVRNKNNTDIPIDINLTTVLDQTSKAISNYIAVFSDISERKQTETQLRKLATFDFLTNLPNRTLFNEITEYVLNQKKLNEGSFSILLLDIDNFKTINDMFGHSIGDKILIQISEKIKLLISSKDTLARLSGDEFTILIDNFKSDIEISEKARLLLELLSEPFTVNNVDVAMSVSIGIVIFPVDGEDIETLLKNAEMAMYEAKSKGRNNYQFYQEKFKKNFLKRVKLENQLRDALRRNTLEIHYQPRWNLSTRSTTHAEALIRWQPEKGKFIPPSEFIPVAEDTNLIIPLGYWIINTVCNQLKKWLPLLSDKLTISVNLSAIQFKQADLVQKIEQILKSNQCPTQLIEFEITESAIIEDTKRAVHIMKQLREQGHELALDDFGTGYSSMNYLIDFPIQFLKVDMSFIKNISHDPKSLMIVKTIKEMGNNLGLKVVAEGVENHEQYALLEQMNCDQIQGYYISEALSAEEFYKFLCRQKNKKSLS